MSHPNLLIGLENADDAGVYKLTDESALIQTVDFFTPIVDDPYTFGQIAVANALSDVYAMGGQPICALNIACFPIGEMDISVLNRVFAGGLEKMREAGVVLAGGHSLDNKELIYGLAVTGTIHPDKILTKKGALPGDRLILTKKLGTGIVNTAVKGDMATPAAVHKVVESMSALNKIAAQLLATYDVHACTDITGFGLVGHLWEMIENQSVSAIINSDAIPYFSEIEEYCNLGMLPGGLHRNRTFYQPHIKMDQQIPQHLTDVVFDPQTSGGLLISLPTDQAEILLAQLIDAGIDAAAIVGKIIESDSNKIIIE
jgi:selenide, water dikinase